MLYNSLEIQHTSIKIANVCGNIFRNHLSKMSLQMMLFWRISITFHCLVKMGSNSPGYTESCRASWENLTGYYIII